MVAERFVALEGLEDEEACFPAVVLLAGFAAGSGTGLAAVVLLAGLAAGRGNEPWVIGFGATSQGTSVFGSAVARSSIVITGRAVLSVVEPGIVVCGSPVFVVRPGTVICRGPVFAVALAGTVVCGGTVFSVAPVPVASAPAAVVVPC